MAHPQVLRGERRWLRFLELDTRSRLRLPPDFAAFVDRAWAPDSRAAFADYLDRGHVAVVIRVPTQGCPLCGEEIHPASFRSDGYLVWPGYLGHFVRLHGVKLRPAFVEHITRNGFSPPPRRTVAPPPAPRRPTWSLRESLR
jgi:hypothetical protein